MYLMIYNYSVIFKMISSDFLSLFLRRILRYENILIFLQQNFLDFKSMNTTICKTFTTCKTMKSEGISWQDCSDCISVICV